jgi:hypothetical protein
MREAFVGDKACPAFYFSQLWDALVRGSAGCCRRKEQMTSMASFRRVSRGNTEKSFRVGARLAGGIRGKEGLL